MPLTKKGMKVLRRFKKEYGVKRGTSVFYAYMKSHPLKTHSFHLKRIH